MFGEVDATKRAKTRPKPEVSQEDVMKTLDEMDVGEIEDLLASIGPSPLKDAIANPDLKIPGLLSKADRRRLRTVSKEFYHPGRKCLDADELKAMRSETKPCKNTARVMYNPEKGIQRALMCAIMSVDKELHVDVEEGHWNKFQENESVKCFDDNYALRVTVLRDVERDVQSAELAKQTLKCKGGYRELETAFVEVRPDRVPIWGNPKPQYSHHRWLDMVSKVQTVRFRREPTVIPAMTFLGHRSLLELPQMPMVKTVEEMAFAGCVNLEHVGRMESIEKVENEAWACCHKLRDAPVMPNLEVIRDYAFSHCSSLLRVDIPEKVTQVGQGAFWACENLGEVRAPPRFYQKPGVSKLAFVSCGKIANYELLRDNNFIVNVQWENEDLLKTEAWYSWVAVGGKILLPDIRRLHFKRGMDEHNQNIMSLILKDEFADKRNRFSLYYGPDTPDRNTLSNTPFGEVFQENVQNTLVNLSPAQLVTLIHMIDMASNPGDEPTGTIS